MATVLFTWELGGGIGHLVRHRGLIQQLLTDGHRVHFHACDLEKAHQVFDGLALELARKLSGTADFPMRPPFSSGSSTGGR